MCSCSRRPPGWHGSWSGWPGSPADGCSRPPGDWVAGALDGLPFWARALAWPALVVAVGWLVGLPIAFWRGYAREKQWGFSTQTRAGWLTDRVKGLAVGTVTTSLMLFGFV